MPKNFIKQKKGLLITFFSVFLVVCLIIANYLSLLLIKTNNTSESVQNSDFELHLLSLAKSQVENEAISLSADYQKIGAGGYIWYYDNYYHVISSAYSNKNDAILVQNSIKTNQNIDSEIITVKFDAIKVFGNFDSEQVKVITASLNSFHKFYLDIYDIAISLDTAVYNEISARLAVNNAHNSLATTLANFETLFQDNSNFKGLYDALKSANQISQLLCSGTLLNNNQTYSSLLKYRYLEILNLYQNIEL